MNIYIYNAIHLYEMKVKANFNYFKFILKHIFLINNIKYILI
jgi:hypothetical protein